MAKTSNLANLNEGIQEKGFYIFQLNGLGQMNLFPWEKNIVSWCFPTKNWGQWSFPYSFLAKFNFPIALPIHFIFSAQKVGDAKVVHRLRLNLSVITYSGIPNANCLFQRWPSPEDHYLWINSIDWVGKVYLYAEIDCYQVKLQSKIPKYMNLCWLRNKADVHDLRCTSAYKQTMDCWALLMSYAVNDII